MNWFSWPNRSPQILADRFPGVPPDLFRGRRGLLSGLLPGLLSGLLSGRPRKALAFLVIFLASLPLSASAAVIERWHVTVDVVATGQLVQQSELRVLLEDPEDVEAWSDYPIYLDDHRHLVSAEGHVIEAGGQRRRIGRKEQDLVEDSGRGILFSSNRYHVFSPQELGPGDRLEIRSEISIEPYFPASQVTLRPGGADVEDLRVEIRASQAGGLRYRLIGDPPMAGAADDGEGRGLKLVESGGGDGLQGLKVTGQLDFLDDRPALAADLRPSLLFAWGESRHWNDVGRWYGRLLGGVARSDGSLSQGLDLEALPGASASPSSAPSASPATQAAGGGNEAALQARARLEGALDFVRRRVRYVAVEVGIGGYRPSPPAEVLERRWGDCKDKSLLLIDLLGEAGIKASPVLVHSGVDSRIEAAFPSHLQFNHLIVAVPTEGIELREGDPVSQGYLFLDPTQSTGSAEFLHRGVQNQHGLVVEGYDGTLVPLPVLPQSEQHELRVELTLDLDSGLASGDLTWSLRGESGSRLAESLEISKPAETEAWVRSALDSLLPGSVVQDLEWSGGTEGMPWFEAKASLQTRGLLGGSQGGSVRLTGPKAMPSTANIDALAEYEQVLPAATAAEHAYQKWIFHLPPGACAPKASEAQVQNSAGKFHQTVSLESDDTLILERRAILQRTWHEAEQLGELRELALAEHRASRRRLRFRCGF